MLEQVYVVTDLGPGDGGKGGIVHALSRQLHADIVIKRGGAQGSHGVRTSFGEGFNFSQWGCGTFNGIPTFLSEQMVISPVGISNESEALKRFGIYDPFALLTCDPGCICATSFHRISSQLEELLLKDNPRGTIGTGIGQAYRMYNALGDEYTLRAHELTDRIIVRTKLQKQLEYYRDKYTRISSDDGLPDDADLFAENLGLLYDDGLLPWCLDLFEDIGARLVYRDLEEVFKENRTAIVECSHGVLTDAETGFKPHVSAIRTLPKFTIEMLRAAGYDGQIINYAVHRAYEIRHGAGPMPTYDPDFTARMITNSHKENNRWQGNVRAGALDVNLLRHALDACSDTSFDGFCLTWFDQILAGNDRIWPICVDYGNAAMANELTIELLEQAQPNTVSCRIKNPIPKRELFDFVGEILQEYLSIPLKMLSVGPTEKHKIVSY